MKAISRCSKTQRVAVGYEPEDPTDARPFTVALADGLRKLYAAPAGTTPVVDEWAAKDLSAETVERWTEPATLARAIKRLSCGKATGTDELPDRFFKACLLYTSPSPRD